MALTGFMGLLLTQAACPLEPDPEVLEACKPQQVQCLQNDRIRRCSDDGIWDTPESFICVAGTCQVMGGEPVCM